MLLDLRMLTAGAVSLGAVLGIVRGVTAPAAELDSVAQESAVHATSAPTPGVPQPPAAAPEPSLATLEEIDEEADRVDTRVRSALDALAASVRRQSDPGALRTAFRAYYNYRSANPGKVRKPYLYFVDYGLDARTPRGYVFDMDALKVVEGPFHVAHGRGSAPTASGIPTRFSNRQGSNSTSLGLYLAQETYGFSGKSGGRAYRSVGLRLTGVSGRFNSAARARGVVVHGAPYVTALLAGRSEGCPAMEISRARRLLPRIAGGGLVFHFSPRDPEWRRTDPWVNRG